MYNNYYMACTQNMYEWFLADDHFKVTKLTVHLAIVGSNIMLDTL